LVTGARDYLCIKFQEKLKYDPDWEYIKIAIKEDHVHMVMVITPKNDVSLFVETIKKNTSRILKKEFNFLRKVYWDNKRI
jgi:REP element-mobilizing transposase RayT